MNRLVLTLALAALLAACSKPAPAPEPVRSVRTLSVAPGSLSATHEFAAEVRARTETRLSFRVGGKLLRRTVDAGDTVRAGQLLAQLDPQDLKLGQDSAQAALRSAQANLDLSQAEYNRYKDLRDQGFISGLELERRETALKAARGTLEQARAQATVQGNQANYATLLADAAGVVTAVDAEPGMVVAAGSSIVRVAHDGPRDVVFSVPEDRVAALRALAARPGALSVGFWGEAGRSVPATVREVAAAADPATRTFLVKADIGNTPVRLGQTATVRLSGPVADAVIRLPLAAVLEQQGKTVVWLLDGASMTVRAQPVQVGGADGNSVVIAAGLQPGQEVVSAGVHTLTPGQKVKRYAEPAAAPKAAAPLVAAPAASR